MTKLERVTKKIEADKEIMKGLSNVKHYSVEDFAKDIMTYIKAIKAGRMLCTIPHVSASGMSRDMSFHSWEGNQTKGYYRQYWAMFKALGYREAGKYSRAFKISGCGMNMVFHTNYTNMHKFKRLGFISAKQCEHLAKQTPTVL